ncbi:MAG: tyrosinase family protein [Pseudonocardiales bacterium]
MAEFDISETVNNIMSSRGSTAQQAVGGLLRTIAGLAQLPGTLLERRRDVGAPAQRRQFNPFSLVEVHAAAVMASKLMEIAEAEADGLAVAIGATASLGQLMGETVGLVGDLSTNLLRAVNANVESIVNEVGMDMLGLIGMRQHALTLFVTHYGPAHEQIKLKPLDQREPNLVSRAGALATPPEENRMSFWREDAQLNDHHGRWHDVNPTGSRPTPSGALPVLANRHGELFPYMHQQMLARYDAERLSAGLPKVKPFDDYRAKIPEGYNPGDKVAISPDDGQTWIKFRARPADVQLKDLSASGGAPPSLIADQEQFRERLRAAAQQGYYQIDNNQIKVTTENFGDTIEASIASVDWPDKKNPRNEINGQNYGNLHGVGHVHFSLFDDPPGGEIGVMMNLAATSRDPIFWRWHKHIDTVIQIWRERLGKQDPHNFADGPPVTVRNQDIIVCSKGGFPANVDGGTLAAKAFGYSKVATENRWDTDFSSGSITVALAQGAKGVKVATTTELLTEMRKRTIYPVNLTTKKAEPESIDYLSHEDFSYFIRLENRSDQAQEITVRIFLAPELWVEDHTAWIEMDRFLHKLKARERAVVFRPARMSAVIRKPAVGHEELESNKPRGSASMWCDCGWPYTLLLPRGTKKGLDFRLLVMLSKDDLIMNDTGQKCTSISYCGLQDQKYPDKRPMGYPFDRPLPDSISSTIDKYDNWASRTIRIRCRNA